MFASECDDFEVTQLQYGALTLLSAEPHLDQITLGKRLGLDRSTIGMVVRNLEERSYIDRVIDPADTRRRTMTITAPGRDLLAALLERAQRAQERLLASLEPHERAVFIATLAKLTRNLNSLMPTPVEAPDPPENPASSSAS